MGDGDLGDAPHAAKPHFLLPRPGRFMHDEHLASSEVGGEFGCEWLRAAAASVRSAIAECSGGGGPEATVATPAPLSVSGSFKEGSVMNLRRRFHELAARFDLKSFALDFLRVVDCGGVCVCVRGCR